MRVNNGLPIYIRRVENGAFIREGETNYVATSEKELLNEAIIKFLSGIYDSMEINTDYEIYIEIDQLGKEVFK